jgi:exodeoxyribonuclease V alpha subunit
MSDVLDTPKALPDGADLLQPYVDGGVLWDTEVHLVATVARLEPDAGEHALLALALAARATRLRNVCVVLADVPEQVVDADDGTDGSTLPWPAHHEWVAALEASPIVATPAAADQEPLRPLVWDGSRVYLQRYWRHEDLAAAQLLRLAGAHDRAEAGDGPVGRALDALFPAPPDGGPDHQRRAAEVALRSGLAVIAGGPGTGKTRTIARLLVALRLASTGSSRPLQVALAAPTGKAAARMTEAVRHELAGLPPDVLPDALASELREVEATTVHRLLGWAPGTGGRFRHDHDHPLPHDLVVVDETSMVSLPLLARLLDAVRHDARLVLVGDPNQLVSVDAGTVMADVVGPAPDTDASVGASTTGPLAGRVTVLQRTHRFGSDSPIAALAAAIRVGDEDRTLHLLAGDEASVRWVTDTDEAGRADLLAGLVERGVEVVRAASAGDGEAALAAAQQVKVLAAVRRHELGVWDWSDRIEQAVLDAVPEVTRTARWYVGRPIIVTANDPLAQVANGDVGVLVEHEGTRAVALPTGDGLRLLPSSRLSAVDTWWAMTIHKSQGSELPHAVVSLPTLDSPVLTRELLYTAVTRAREQVTVVGSEAAVVAALRRPVARASGLRDRLWPA